MRHQTIVPSLGTVFGVVSAVLGAQLQPVPSGWDNPTKLSMNIYIPDKLATNPPVIIVVRISFPFLSMGGPR